MRRGAVHGGVARIVLDAAARQFTGAIEIEGLDVGGTIFLSEGLLYWAKLAGTADVSETVAGLPVNGATLSRIRWHMSNGLTLAAAIDKVDGIDQSTIRRAVRDMAERSCRRLMAVEEGHFYMTPSVGTLMGVLDRWPVSASVLPAEAPTSGPGSGAAPVELVPRPPELIVRLDDMEWRVVAALATPLSPAVIAERAGLPTDEVVAAIARMRERQLVTPAADEPDAREWRPPPRTERAAAPAATPRPDPGPVAATPAFPRLATPRLAVPDGLVAANGNGRPADPPAPADHPRPPAEPAPRPAAAAEPVAEPDDRRSSALRRLMSAVRRI
ncbi:MAG TPA: helix-turn-helix domain-containing protein [Acidimicrobiales bacterium]|nr:helix-turn-helix domain-containing protein [Acidimicrobiales bacterium]